MKVIVLGAGAIGGYCGAQLARAGHDVTFVARGEHLRAIQAHGLTLETPSGRFVVQGAATDNPRALEPADLVIAGIKTYDNRTVLPVLPSIVESNSIVLTFQNGVDSADEIAAVIGRERVLAGAAYVATARTAPGVITQTGTHRRFVFGEPFGVSSEVSPRVARLTDAFAAADMHPEPVADVRALLWEKLIYLSAFASVSAITRLPMGAIRGTPALRERLFATIDESERVAVSGGVPLVPGLRDRIASHIDTASPATRASMLFDLLAGNRLELDAVVGALIRRARAQRVPVPILETLYALLKPYEGGQPA
jgi:2-dehydropantoate 2-reductase